MIFGCFCGTMASRELVSRGLRRFEVRPYIQIVLTHGVNTGQPHPPLMCTAARGSIYMRANDDIYLGSLFCFAFDL